ncbi:MAG: S9 family peptidase, partial [Aquaticitalea sp.]
MKKYTFLLLVLFGINQIILAQDDKYQWLEEVDGAKALEFVNSQNKSTIDKLSKEEDYQSIYDKTLEIYNSSDRIAYPTILGNYVYNFWKD